MWTDRGDSPARRLPCPVNIYAMDKRDLSRRQFLKSVGAVGAAFAVNNLFGGIDLSAFRPEVGGGGSSTIFTRRELRDFNRRFDACGLPVAVLGKSGVVVPRMGLGLGSRFCNFALRDMEGAYEMLLYALDNGLYYWDTAPAYSASDPDSGRTVLSEEVAGQVIKGNRERIFLNTKVCTRDPDEMMRSIERSLRLLNTDYLDMLMIHSIDGMPDYEKIRANRLIERLEELREQKLFRLFGFSSHDDAAGMRAMVETGHFDVMLAAMDTWRRSNTGLRSEVAKMAFERGMGVMLMKAVRGYQDNGMLVDFNQAVIQSLQYPNATGVMIGMDSREIVDKNLKILREL